VWWLCPEPKKKKAAALAIGKKAAIGVVAVNPATGGEQALVEGAPVTIVKPAVQASLANFNFEVTNFIQKKQPTPPSSPNLAGLVGMPVSSICYLCNRKFPSQDMLKRHAELSNLHKENLAKAATKERERRAAVAKS